MAERKNYVVDTDKSGLNVREAPNVESSILRMVPNGERISVDHDVETPDGWLAVKGGGYVMSMYLK